MTVESILARIGTLPKSARVLAIAAVAGILLVTVLAGLAGHVARTALFASPLRAEQLSEVEEQLASWNVAFVQDGSNVLVDSAKRNDLLMRLSLSGIPHAHIQTTNETLANVGVLTPGDVIEAQTRSGLAGDIALGLRGVEGIDDAAVIVAPAKTAQFADESSHAATASVRVRLRPGARLSREAVAGIRAFVAASVPALEAERVTVLDDRGLALDASAPAPDDVQGMQSSLQSALDASLGAGVAIVRVRTDYDLSQSEQRETKRAPLLGAAIARTTGNESYNDGSKHYAKGAQTEDRGSDSQEYVRRTPAGRIARISAAVFVDASRALDLAKVRELSSATLGLDFARGDTLAVASMDFHRAAVPRRDGFWLAYNGFVGIVPMLVLGTCIVMVVRLAVPPIVSLARSGAERASLANRTQTVSGYPPAQVRGALANEPPHAAAAIISALPAATAAAVLELYPAAEREAIVRRMQRPQSPIAPTIEEVLGYRA